MTTADFIPCPPCQTPDACGKVSRWLDCFPDDYAALRAILDAALAQSAEGKGRERHADGRPWEAQPINTITAAVGIGFPLGQAVKKLTEAAGMLRRGEADAARAELLGAIVYTAAAVHAVEK